jgi:hypothetical protein
MKDSEDLAPCVQSQLTLEQQSRRAAAYQDHGTSLKTRRTTLVPMP